MFKILFMTLLAFTLASSAEMGKNGGGCVLAQKGEFKVGFNETKLDGVVYTPNAKSGKNFREIFVGSTVTVKSDKLTSDVSGVITDYKPNKRMKGKPKTGIFIVELSVNNVTTTIPMNYIFNKGVMSAEAILNTPMAKSESVKVWFVTDVEYSLCYSK